ncbi:unnamed protein product [Arctia plantaginis]|uniref:Uncharacterized protein n=1 Tax=Arctia plantaginis TaxID=874455 RepID=A0A8S0ZHL5_ARCPL|nr:unnamed protein product [Arctia plantaginis]CAB3252434.1 unnamed protein product [Arctia plantaginis]
MNNGTTILLGRQWISELAIPVKVPQLELQNHFKDELINKEKLIKDIICRHKGLFDGTLGRYTGARAELFVRDSVQPIYWCARPVARSRGAGRDAERRGHRTGGALRLGNSSGFSTQT